jgi:hypothetical protein
MGKRSRKRPAPDRAPATRAERDARRRTAAATPTVGRRGTRERPPAPWGSFPLTELVVLISLVIGVVGFIRLDTRNGKLMVGAAMVLGSLGGLEVSVREHFAGFKSHTSLLAASTAVVSMIVVSAVGGTSGLAVLGIVVAVGILVFVLSFWGYRQAFMRRSGGLGFR